MFNRESVEKNLVETEELIERCDALEIIAIVTDDSELIKKLIDKRIELARIKGELEYMLTLC